MSTTDTISRGTVRQIMAVRAELISSTDSEYRMVVTRNRVAVVILKISVIFLILLWMAERSWAGFRD